MYISLNWLKSFISLKKFSGDIILKETTSVDTLLQYYKFPVNQLTLAGFEIEDITCIRDELAANIVIEIDTTPNRSDVNNMVGFSRELQSLMNFPLQKFSTYPNINQIPTYLGFSKSGLKNERLASSEVSSIFFQQLSNVNIKDSPPWLKKRLTSVNINPTNNIIDLTNYSMAEWGQPMQVYDLDKISKLTQTDQDKNLTISIRNAYSNETFIASNNVSYELSGENLLITANNIPIGIAGIIGSADTLVDENTTTILLECGHFDTKRIRQSTKRLGLRTEVASLYEKGISPITPRLAFQHTLKLLNLTTDAKVKHSHILFKTNSKLSQRILSIQFTNVNKILGSIKTNSSSSSINLTRSEILECFKRLNFNVINVTSENVLLTIPEYRTHDIESEIDVIEEIGRIYGFNKFLPILPSTKSLGKISGEQKFIELTRKFLINNSFNELIEYSLVLGKVGQNQSLLNPLSQEYSSLRTTLLPNIIETIQYNIKQRNECISGFEIGRVFNKNLNREATMVAGIFGGQSYRSEWTNQYQTLSWYEAKATINNLLQALNIDLEWSQIKSNLSPQFHSGRSAVLHRDFKELGIFTQIHPLYAKQNNLPTSLFLFELNLTQISKLDLTKTKKYERFSIYPKITKDISFEVSNTITVDQFINNVKTLVQKQETENIFIELELFDNYQNPKLLSSRILGLTLTYKSLTRTLLTADIDDITCNIVDEVNNLLNV